jgi:hypothetical protein
MPSSCPIRYGALSRPDSRQDPGEVFTGVSRVRLGTLGSHSIDAQCAKDQYRDGAWLMTRMKLKSTRRMIDWQRLWLSDAAPGSHTQPWVPIVPMREPTVCRPCSLILSRPTLLRSCFCLVALLMASIPGCQHPQLDSTLSAFAANITITSVAVVVLVRPAINIRSTCGTSQPNQAHARSTAFSMLAAARQPNRRATPRTRR